MIFDFAFTCSCDMLTRRGAISGGENFQPFSTPKLDGGRYMRGHAAMAGKIFLLAYGLSALTYAE